MMSVMSPTGPTSLLGATEPELTLRICNGAQRGQLVRLTAPKCTIGSAPSCTLRLRGEQIAPWHCVVLRGQQRTIIRRLSAATRLNHAAFDDAELVSGDRLTVGNVEFEVLAGPHSLRPRMRPEDQQQFDTLEQRRQLANRLGRDRLRRVLHRLRKAERRLLDSEQRRRQYERDVRDLETRHEQLVIQREQLDAALVELRGREAAAAEQAKQSQLQSQQHKQSLSELRDQFEHAQQDFAQQQAQWDAQHAEWQRDQDAFERQRAALETERAELAARHAAWTQTRQQQLDELHQLEQSLAAREATVSEDARTRQAALDELARSLAARNTAVEVEQQALASERAVVTQLRAQLELDHATQQARWQAEAAAQAAEINHRHEALEQQHSDLLGRTSELQSLRAELDAEREQLAVQAAALALRAQESPVAVEHDESLAEEAARLSEQQAQLSTAWAELAQQQAALTTARQTLDEQRRAEQTALDEQRAALATERDSLSREREQFQHDSTQAAQRQQELSIELARQQQELDRRSTELADRGEVLLQLQQRLEYEQAQLAEATAASAQASKAEPRELATEDAAPRAAILAELQLAHQALVEQQAAMDDEREQIILEKAEWKREYEAWQREVAEEAERRAAAAAELARQEEDLRQRLSEHAQQHEQAQRELPHDDHDETFEERAQRIRNELLAQAEALRAESIDVSRHDDEPAPAVESEPAQTKPVVDTPQASPEPEPLLIRSHERESAAEVMRRMGLLSDLNDDEGVEPASAQASAQPIAPQPSTEPAPVERKRPAPEPAGDEEEDISAYMAQLLQRVGGRKGEAVEPSAPAARSEAAPASPTTTAASEPAPEPEPAQPLLDPREMTPRSLPPELSANLSAMRAIANRNARDAVTKHMITKTTGSRDGRMYVIATSALALPVLAWFYFSGNEWALMPLALAGVTLMVWGLMAYRETRRLKDINQKQHESH